MQMISMPNGIEVHSVNDHDHVVHVAGDDDDNADDDASPCCPNKIVKCPTTHTHTLRRTVWPQSAAVVHLVLLSYLL